MLNLFLLVKEEGEADEDVGKAVKVEARLTRKFRKAFYVK